MYVHVHISHYIGMQPIIFCLFNIQFPNEDLTKCSDNYGLCLYIDISYSEQLVTPACGGCMV